MINLVKPLEAKRKQLMFRFCLLDLFLKSIINLKNKILLFTKQLSDQYNHLSIRSFQTNKYPPYYARLLVHSLQTYHYKYLTVHDKCRSTQRSKIKTIFKKVTLKTSKTRQPFH